MNYNTQLNPELEKSYRQWMENIGHTPQNGFNVDKDYTGNDYDYRGFFKKYGFVDVGNGQHLTDEYKKPNHQTFSNQSIYSQPGKLGGNWNGDNFSPSALNMLFASITNKGQPGISSYLSNKQY